MATTESTIAGLLAWARDELSATSESPDLDAEVLLATALDKPRSYLRAWPEALPEQAVCDGFRQQIEQRRSGHPVAHLTGQREFWSLELKVTRDTLIPRPDIETLVEHALSLIDAHHLISVIDLGTGSGAIALALAHERPALTVTAVDRNTSALTVAADNARRLGIRNVRFAAGHWLAAVPDTPVDLIVSNPPYIAEHDPRLTSGDVAFEPREALVSGPDGLRDIRLIVQQSAQRLGRGGILVLEHGYDQASDVAALLRQQNFGSIQSVRDLGGNPRVSSGVRGPDPAD